MPHTLICGVCASRATGFNEPAAGTRQGTSSRQTFRNPCRERTRDVTSRTRQPHLPGLGSPGLGGEIAHARILNHEIAAHGDEGTVESKLFEDVRFVMVRVQDHHDPFTRMDQVLHLLDHAV
jgi:hypothetical protein